VTSVLDASALLVLLFKEKGADLVEAALDGGVMSTVNWSEVQQKLAQRGVDMSVVDAIQALGLGIEPFTIADAARAAELWVAGRSVGLSLGDRACLALAHRLDCEVITADSAWTAVDAGVAVRQVR
jgi:PIN domain nuclease of toxin-antitoxin system